MEPHLTVLAGIAAVWLVAGALADGLPRLRRADDLRRRTGWLTVLTLTGLGLMAAVVLADLVTVGPTVADRAAVGLALPAVPALAVAGCTVRRLRRLRAGAGAFATAPGTPAPPGLRAAAAHPLVGLPLQVTGLATVPAVLAAGWSGLTAPPGGTGPALTLGALVVLAIGVRHALRHSRFAERAGSDRVGPVPAVAATGAPRVVTSAGAAGALHV